MLASLQECKFHSGHLGPQLWLLDMRKLSLLPRLAADWISYRSSEMEFWVISRLIPEPIYSIHTLLLFRLRPWLQIAHTLILCKLEGHSYIPPLPSWAPLEGTTGGWTSTNQLTNQEMAEETSEKDWILKTFNKRLKVKAKKGTRLME